MKTEKNEIIRRIEELREERGLSKHAMAKLCDLSYDTLKNSINRNSMPEIYTVQQICKGLDITLAEFFTSPGIFGTYTKSQETVLRYWNKMSRGEKEITLAFMKGICKENE